MSYQPVLGDIALVYVPWPLNQDPDFQKVHYYCVNLANACINGQCIACDDTFFKTYGHSELVDPANWHPEQWTDVGYNYEVYRENSGVVDHQAALDYWRWVVANRMDRYYIPYDAWDYLFEHGELENERVYIYPGQTEYEYDHLSSPAFSMRKWMCISLTMCSIYKGWYAHDPQGAENFTDVHVLAKIENMAPGQIHRYFTEVGYPRVY